jgi:hypothetical protein
MKVKDAIDREYILCPYCGRVWCLNNSGKAGAAYRHIYMHEKRFYKYSGFYSLEQLPTDDVNRIIEGLNGEDRGEDQVVLNRRVHAAMNRMNKHKQKAG